MDSFNCDTLNYLVSPGRTCSGGARFLRTNVYRKFLCQHRRFGIDASQVSPNLTRELFWVMVHNIPQRMHDTGDTQHYNSIGYISAHSSRLQSLRTIRRRCQPDVRRFRRHHSFQKITRSIPASGISSKSWLATLSIHPSSTQRTNHQFPRD